MNKLSLNGVKVNGYVLTLGYFYDKYPDSYSETEPTNYLFKELPNVEKMKSDMEKLKCEEDFGAYEIRDEVEKIIKKHGGVEIKPVINVLTWGGSCESPNYGSLCIIDELKDETYDI